jgi:Arm DNA-binding domain
MPHATLTDVAVRAAKPPESGATTLWDGSLKHFGLRVSQGGAKSFIVLLGSGRRQAIGRWPTISLAQARTKAKIILAERTLGKHQLHSIAWTAARDTYIDEIRERNRESTAYEYERILNKHFPLEQVPA